MKHPLDVRGSRRSLEAAKLFLSMDARKANPKHKISFLETSISLPQMEQHDDSDSTRTVCPTVACDWIAAFTLNTLRKRLANLIDVTGFWMEKYFDLIRLMVGQKQLQGYP